MGRMNFPSEYGFDNPYLDFHGRNVPRGYLLLDFLPSF